MRVLEIALEDEGEQIVARQSGVSLRTFNEIIGLWNAAVAGKWPDDLRPLYAAWAPLIESWSFPEKPSAEALEGRDPNVVMAAILAWVKGVRNVPLPLLQTSSGTAPSREPSTNQRRSRRRSSTTR